MGSAKQVLCYLCQPLTGVLFQGMSGSRKTKTMMCIQALFSPSAYAWLSSKKSIKNDKPELQVRNCRIVTNFWSRWKIKRSCGFVSRAVPILCISWS